MGWKIFKPKPTTADLAYVKSCLANPRTPQDHAVKKLYDGYRLMQNITPNPYTGGDNGEVDLYLKSYDQFEKQFLDRKQRERIHQVVDDLARNKKPNYSEPISTSKNLGCLVIFLIFVYLNWPKPSAPITSNITYVNEKTAWELKLEELQATPTDPPRIAIAAPPANTDIACPTGCDTPSPNCLIKGNISLESGAKIYHLPGQKFYTATVIDPRYGERWFCTESEAIANGWRRSAQ